jgi:hypothetical protein
MVMFPLANKKGAVKEGRIEVEIDMNSGSIAQIAFFMNGALIILVICGKLQSHLIQTN